MWDVAGREYIDYHLGSGPALLGHAHPAVTAAVAAQLPKGTTYYFLNEPEIVLAQKLVDAIPCADAVHYVGSGTEATFYALRIARAFTGRNKVMKFEGAWHGMHDYGLWGTVPATASPLPARAARLRRRAAGDRRHRARRAVQRRRAGGRDDRAPRARSSRPSSSSRCSACCCPSPGFLAALRDVTKRHGIVLIFDEIVTGFRIAWGGAQQKYGVVPDLACYGKAVSGGYPLAAIAGSADVLSVLDARSRPRATVVWATNTLNGNPVCAAAGCAALDVLGAAGRLRPAGDGRAAAARGPGRRGHAPRLRRAGARRGRGVRHPLHRPAPAAQLDGPADRRQGPRASLGARTPASAACSSTRTRSSTSRSCTATTTSRARSRSRTTRSRRCVRRHPPRDSP